MLDRMVLFINEQDGGFDYGPGSRMYYVMGYVLFILLVGLAILIYCQCLKKFCGKDKKAKINP